MSLGKHTVSVIVAWFVATTMVANVHAGTMFDLPTRESPSNSGSPTGIHPCAIGYHESGDGEAANAAAEDDVSTSCFASCGGLVSAFVASVFNLHHHVLVDGWTTGTDPAPTTFRLPPPVRPPRA